MRMLLTAKELAKALDVHITTIRWAYHTKRIPYERLCKLYYFDLEKVRSAMRRDGFDLTATTEGGTPRATAARTKEKPQVGKSGAFMADGRSGNVYQ